jgi:hypothetical protein
MRLFDAEHYLEDAEPGAGIMVFGLARLRPIPLNNDPECRRIAVIGLRLLPA